MWTGLSPIGSNIGRAFFLSVIFDTTIYPWYIIRINKRSFMIVEKNKHGAYVISDIVKGYWIHKQYYFYNKKEAIKLFRKFRKEHYDGSN